MLKKLYIILWVVVGSFLVGIVSFPFVFDTKLGKEIITGIIGESDNGSLSPFNHRNYKVLVFNDGESAVPYIKANLDSAEKELNSLFGYIPSEPLSIKIDSKKKGILTNVLDGEGEKTTEGFYLNNNIRIFAGDTFKDLLSSSTIYTSSFSHKLKHEYTHYYLDMYCKENGISIDSIPQWFNEGLCEYIGNNNISSNDKITFTPFNKLFSTVDWKNSSVDAYYQGHLAVSKIVSLYGKDKIKNIILGCKNNDFNASFKKNTGVKIEGFQYGIERNCVSYFSSIQSYGKPNSDKNLEKIRVDCLEKYVTINPDSPDAYWDIGAYYHSNKNIPKAIKVVEEGLKYNPHSKRLEVLQSQLTN